MPPKRSSGSSHRSSSPSRSASSRSSASRSSAPSRPASAAHTPSRPASARPDRPVSSPARPAVQPQRPPRSSGIPNVAPLLYADQARRQARNAYSQGYMAGSMNQANMNGSQPMYGTPYNNYEQPQTPESFICEYCGYQTTDPTQNLCPSCGAPLISTAQAAQTPAGGYQEPSYSAGAKVRPAAGKKTSVKKKSPIKFILLAIVLLFLVLTVLKMGGAKRNRGEDPANTSASSKTLHVDVLGRDLVYDAESDSYYDKKTDCYLADLGDRYQYWYEGISSDFGDYGWMEYDVDEAQWYIEQDQNDWVKLPSEYDTSSLWHIEE